MADVECCSCSTIFLKKLISILCTLPNTIIDIVSRAVLKYMYDPTLHYNLDSTSTSATSNCSRFI